MTKSKDLKISYFEKLNDQNWKFEDSEICQLTKKTLVSQPMIFTEIKLDRNVI